MTGEHYEIGWHSSDGNYCHVALVNDYCNRDEQFDVQLYAHDVIEDDGRTAYAASLAALEEMVKLANAALELKAAVERAEKETA